jgi:hypothetical protein
MALTITARPDAPAYAVRLTVTGAAGAPFTVTAEPVGGTAYAVRLIGDPVTDPADVTDFEAPFGVAIRYTVNVSGVTANVLADPLEASGVVLSSTMRAGSARPVTLVADQPHDWTARSAWFDVIGRRDPLVTVDTMRYRSGVWEFRAGNRAARAALLDLIVSGEPLLLRSGCPDDVDDAIALPLRASEDPVVGNRGPRLFRVEYQAVTRTVGPYAGASAWTFAHVADYADTFTDLAAAFVSFRDLSLGPPDAAAAADADPARFGVVL